MLTPTPAGATWPARLAYCAYNFHFGVSIVFALSWLALIKAVERRRERQ
jgi:hypothetical protein